MTSVERIAPIVKLSLKTLMLKSSLYDYTNAQILVSETIKVAELQAGEGNYKYRSGI